MNSTLFTLAVIQILVSLCIAIAVLYISFKMLRRVFFNNNIDENHISFTVFTAGIFISIGMILSEIIPSIATLMRLSVQDEAVFSMGKIVMYCGIYLIIGFIYAVLINLASFVLFTGLTKGLNEFKEIKNNNIAIAILVVAAIISITLITKGSIATIIESLIPYPGVTNYLGQ